MREINNKTFLTLTVFFLFYLYIKNIYLLDFLYFHDMTMVFIFLVGIVAAIWVTGRLDKWLATKRWKNQIMLISSALLILFFSYQMFTPYFYTDNQLREIGVGKVEDYLQLYSDENMAEMERSKLAKATLVEGLVFANSIADQYPKVEVIENVKIIDFIRSFHQFELVVNGELADAVNNQERRTYRFTLEKEGLGYKISGFTHY
ncbi:hypothetical protein [Sutcliffiella deserti]|uniref:hypothetical protein n=1 Tax=Sutcliffiella deserti TaxID=2875501 RepID=UPI001CBF3F4B|nr:hypothetical protein [Sutcliffiella deserti]